MSSTSAGSVKLPILEGNRTRRRGCGVDLVRCTRCGLPETYETIEFDAAGVCNICRQQDFKKQSIDWTVRGEEFGALVEEYRGKYDYDCIIPFSGGKDSTFTLYHMVKTYKVKPLVVQFNHGFMRANLLRNNERTFKALGVEVLSFTPNWRAVRRVMLEALVRKGDFCWHCHTGIFSYPMHVALKFNVPFIVWGEPSSEYTAYYDYRDNDVEQVDETRFNRFINLGITAEDMAGMIKGDFQFDPRDLAPFTYPPIRELKKLRYRSVCLGSYMPWDAKTQSELIRAELGWQGDQVEGMPDGMWPYEKIECSMQGVRDYIKFLKRGYSRVSQMLALDLRNGRISKEAADQVVATTEGARPPSLDLFLDYVGLTEQEFNQVVLATVVAPHKPDFAALANAPRTADFDSWYRETRPLR